MNSLTVIECQDVLVVDSRLIALSLGVDHNDWFNDILIKYQTQTEQAFGIVRFKTVKTGKRGRPERYALLTEDQATFLMTLSRNTPEVVQCKLELVQAFSKAKQLLQSQTQQHPYQRVWYQRMMLFEQITKIPPGYFCIFAEIAPLMRDLEAKGVVVYDRATIDISVGRCWCHWLDIHGQSINFIQYEHHYPDKRQIQLANIYPDDLLPLFRKWLHSTYIPDKFPAYVREICSPEECLVIAQAIGHNVKPKQKRLKKA